MIWYDMIREYYFGMASVISTCYQDKVTYGHLYLISNLFLEHEIASSQGEIVIFAI